MSVILADRSKGQQYPSGNSRDGSRIGDNVDTWACEPLDIRIVVTRSWATQATINSGSSIAPVCVSKPEYRYLSGNRHKSAYFRYWPFLSVPSDVTGAILGGSQRYSTGT